MWYAGAIRPCRRVAEGVAAGGWGERVAAVAAGRGMKKVLIVDDEAGFEGSAILAAVTRLMELIADNHPSIVNAYAGIVRPGGNKVARDMIEKVFEPCDAQWRGMGHIGNSGLAMVGSVVDPYRMDSRSQQNVMGI